MNEKLIKLSYIVLITWKFRISCISMYSNQCIWIKFHDIVNVYIGWSCIVNKYDLWCLYINFHRSIIHLCLSIKRWIIVLCFFKNSVSWYHQISRIFLPPCFDRNIFQKHYIIKSCLRLPRIIFLYNNFLFLCFLYWVSVD
jgi:hypothetical protein